MPEQRVNKLGHVVTKHVRSGPSKASETAPMPAPKITPGSPAKRVNRKPPTTKQMLPHKGTQLIPFTADPRLAELIGARGTMARTTSDYDMFKLSSVVSLENAFALASKGIEDREETVELLKNNGMEDLLLDRRELMDIAISMRVRPESMLLLSRRYKIEKYDPEVYATACLLAGSKHEMTVNAGSSYEGYLHDSLLTDRISFDDVKVMEPRFFLGSNNVGRIHLALMDRHLSGASFSLEVIKHVDRYGNYHGEFRLGLKLAETYGNDFVLGLKGIEGATAIERDYKHLPQDYRRELIAYQDKALATKGVSLQLGSLSHVVELYDNGVPAEYVNAFYTALKTHNTDPDSSEIIEAHAAGVPADHFISMK